MQAVILAGGFGTRLRPLTYSRAKPLLPILNKPMIMYIVDMLPPEVDKVIIAVNYKKDQIEHYFKNHDIGKDVIVNDEPVPLGTGGATKFAQKHITNSFFVLNSDNICSLDLSKMMQFHTQKKAVATISLWSVKNVSEFGVVAIKQDGNIVGFVEKPKPEDAPSELINAGAYLLEPEVLDYIKPDRLVSMEKEIFPQIIQKTGKFFGYQFTGYWIDVGRITSYHTIHQLLLQQQNRISLQGDRCNILGDLVYSCVGNHVVVGEQTTLKSTIVFNHSSIGDQVLLENCVVGERCKILNGAQLRNVVVGDEEVIPANSTLENRLVWNQPIPKGYPEKQIGNVIGE